MSLETFEEWISWFSDLGLSKEVSSKYAQEFVDGGMNEDELDELSHGTLKELGITSQVHRLKILKKAKTGKGGQSSTRKAVKSDAIPFSDSVNPKSPAMTGANLDGANIGTLVYNENPPSSSGRGNVNEASYKTTNESTGGDTENINEPTFKSPKQAGNNSTTNNINRANFETVNRSTGGKTSNINKPTFG